MSSPEMRQRSLVPQAVFRQLMELPASPARDRHFATLARVNTLSMIMMAGSGHIGSSFSSIEIFSHLFLNVLRQPNRLDGEGPRDIFFSSKGHDAPGLYAVMIGCDLLPESGLETLRRIDGLPGHPDVATPGIVTNTGSLGMGISKARGFAMADRLRGRDGRVYVLTGDGELQEGQIWESLGPTANGGFANITVIVDHNKYQSDIAVSRVSDLGDLEAKFRAFGWHVERCNGNDIGAFAAALSRSESVQDRPKAIIADTVKGAGVSFMAPDAGAPDELYRFHSGAPSEADYARALEELLARAGEERTALGLPALQPRGRSQAARTAAQAPRLIDSYAEGLVAHGAARPDLVVLDADLMLDCGLIPFKTRFSERFIECGIAEQDMVSQAGTLAAAGFLPVVNSFACFLTTRANEQIYNNATEGTKLIYMGALAGLLPGGPGHSHQSVRDISILAAVPGLTLIQPCAAEELVAALDWAVNENRGSTYLRLSSLPCATTFDLPQPLDWTPGRGNLLRAGSDAVLFGYGPQFLTQALLAAEQLDSEYGISLAVYSQPWLNRVDAAWLADCVAGFRHVFTLDDHYLAGGQGQLIAATLARSGAAKPVISFGVERVPVCGSNDEVLAAHGLDAASLANGIGKSLGA